MTTRIYKTNVQANVPTPNAGKVFSQEKLEGAIREYLDSDNHMGMLEQPGDDGFELIPEQVSHIVKNVFLDEDGVMNVEVSFLDTEEGNIAKFTPDLLEATVAMIGFCGWEGDSNIVEEAALINVNLQWKAEEIELVA